MRSALIVVGIGVGVLLAGGWASGGWLSGGSGIPFEEQFIFFPSREIVATPDRLGLPYEEARFGPNGRLRGWFIPGSGTSPITFLWFQGNGGNMSHRLELLRRLRNELDVNVFIFGYQGYGLSEGRPSEVATQADARAALAYVRGRGDVDAERLVYYGKSLGAAVAVELATEAPPHRLVVQSAFTSIADMAAIHYPFLRPLRGRLRTHYPTIERIGRVAAPVLVVHGERDEVTPIAHGRALYEAAAEPKRLLIIPGARHNDVLDVGGRAYLDALREFCGIEPRP